MHLLDDEQDKREKFLDDPTANDSVIQPEEPLSNPDTIDYEKWVKQQQALKIKEFQNFHNRKSKSSAL